VFGHSRAWAVRCSIAFEYFVQRRGTVTVVLFGALCCCRKHSAKCVDRRTGFWCLFQPPPPIATRGGRLRCLQSFVATCCRSVVYFYFSISMLHASCFMLHASRSMPMLAVLVARCAVLRYPPRLGVLLLLGGSRLRPRVPVHLSADRGPLHPRRHRPGHRILRQTQGRAHPAHGGGKLKL